MIEPVKVAFTLTRPEVSKAFRTFALRGPIYQGMAIAIPVVFAIAMVSGGATAAMPVVVLTVGLLTAVSMVPVLLWKSSDTIRYEQQIVATPEQLVQKARGGQSKLQWSFFERAIETRDFYLLCQNRRYFVIVPRKAFTEPEQDQAFRGLLATHGLI